MIHAEDLTRNIHQCWNCLCKMTTCESSTSEIPASATRSIINGEAVWWDSRATTLARMSNHKSSNQFQLKQQRHSGKTALRKGSSSRLEQAQTLQLSSTANQFFFSVLQKTLPRASLQRCCLSWALQEDWKIQPVFMLITVTQVVTGHKRPCWLYALLGDTFPCIFESVYLIFQAFIH